MPASFRTDLERSLSFLSDRLLLLTFLWILVQKDANQKEDRDHDGGWDLNRFGQSHEELDGPAHKGNVITSPTSGWRLRTLTSATDQVGMVGSMDPEMTVAVLIPATQSTRLTTAKGTRILYSALQMVL